MKTMMSPVSAMRVVSRGIEDFTTVPRVITAASAQQSPSGRMLNASLILTVAIVLTLIISADARATDDVAYVWDCQNNDEDSFAFNLDLECQLVQSRRDMGVQDVVESYEADGFMLEIPSADVEAQFNQHYNVEGCSFLWKLHDPPVGGFTYSDAVVCPVPLSEPTTSSGSFEATVRQTVAGIAAATVSNVTSNIGARFSGPSAPTGGVSMSVTGTPLSFGPEDPRYGERFGPADVVGENRWQWRHRTISADGLLRTSSFTITLGAAEGTDGVSPGIGNRVTVWGRGDLQFFESGGDGASGYDGDLVAGYLGADIAMDGGWLAGVAVSRIASEADYTLSGAAGDGGTLEAELTNVHPYVRTVLGERSEAWAILGFGMGEVTDSTQDGSESKSDLTMRMLSTGVRHLLESDIGINLALLGDGSFAMVETEDGVQSIDGISADVWRARFGVEASRTRVSSNGKAVTTFLEIAARQDGGDGIGGLGLELSPGLSFTDLESRFALEARGRVLALHSADNHQEYGASLTASIVPGAGGRGLSMALTPRWGAPDNALNESAGNLLLGDAGSGHSANRLSLNSRVAYGFEAGEGTVSPFAELSLHDGDDRRMRIGSRYSLGSSLDLELSAARNEGAFSDAADNSVQLSGRIRF